MKHEQRLELLQLLSQEIPSCLEGDIHTIINIIEQLTVDTDDSSALSSEWTPAPRSVLEVLRMGVTPLDLNDMITGFITFAKQRGYDNNLDAKFITHVKMNVA